VKEATEASSESIRGEGTYWQRARAQSLLVVSVIENDQQSADISITNWHR